MKTLLALALLTGVLCTGSDNASAADGVETQRYSLEADLDRCCSDEHKKRWKGHVQRILETADGSIIEDRFVARAAFSTRSYDIGTIKALAKQGVTLKLSNSSGPYAECHLRLKNFDTKLDDWNLITTAAFGVFFDARMRKGQWIVKKNKKDEFCDVNVGQPDAHLGIPELQIGDLVEVLEGSARVLDGVVRLEDD